VQRSFRLTSTGDFRRTRDEGSAHKDRLLVVIVRPNGLCRSRFGFVTSKRLGGAVQRNRTRRLMREAARSLLPSVSPGYDIVVIATRPAVGAALDAISQSLQRLLKQAGLLAQPN
jgi:ribonuclease P protein component